MASKKAPRSVQGGSNCFPEGVTSSDCSPTAHMDPTWTPNEPQVGVILGSSWGHLGVVLVSSWGHLGVTLGSLWDHFEVTLGSHWDHIGITLGSLWHRSGTKDLHQNVAEQIWAPESRSRAIYWGKMTSILKSTRSDWSWATKRGWRQRAKPLGYKSIYFHTKICEHLQKPDM